jgi:Ca2+-transporting ATPase
MAIGVHRMSRQHALVRRLPAVETLGSATVVCSDKTGTLTEGRQTVTAMWLWDREIAVREGEPGFHHGGSADEALPSELASALEIGALANRATLSRREHALEGLGDPTEVALLVAADRAGIARGKLLDTSPRVAEVPFSSRRMYMATVHQASTGELVAMMKGAPSVVLSRCTKRATSDGVGLLTPLDRERVERAATELAARGLRVLGLARGTVASSAEGALEGLTFVGIVGIADPTAPGVAESIHALHAAGVRTIMLTGDHEHTALSVGRDAGLLAGGGKAMTGAEVDRLSDRDLAHRVGVTSIVSRVSPEAKLRIVAALQASGEVVAMIGDGINDTAALKKADIGVAMGSRGSDAAKEVAGIVLADDRFSTIVAALREGRVIFGNIQKFIFYLFSCNLAEIFALFGAVLLGWPLPATPLQILWLNLVTDSAPALALAFEPAESDVMHRRPRDPRDPVVSRRMLRETVIFAASIAAVTLIALGGGLAVWPDAAEAAVTLSFTTLALAQLLHLGNARSRHHVATPARAVSNRLALGALVAGTVLQVVAVSWTPLSTILGATPIPYAAWAAAAGLGVVPALIGQASKWWSGRRVVRAV